MPDPRGAANASRRAFWRAVCAGLHLEDAAKVAGLSRRSAHRWVHDAGGMPPLSLSEPVTTRKLSIGEREAIEMCLS